MLRTSACVGEMRNRVLASSETCEEAGAAQWRILTDADEILRRNEAVVIRFNKKVIEKGDERAFQELMRKTSSIELRPRELHPDQRQC